MMRLRVGVCWTEAEKATIVAQAIFSPDADVVLGNGPPATLNVADWVGPPVLVIAGSTGHVHLAPGMRVNMCRSDGPSGSSERRGAARGEGPRAGPDCGEGYEHPSATGAVGLREVPAPGRARLRHRLRVGQSALAFLPQSEADGKPQRRDGTLARDGSGRPQVVDHIWSRPPRPITFRDRSALKYAETLKAAVAPSLAPALR